MINLWIIEKKGKTIKAAVQSLKGYNCNVLTFMLRKQNSVKYDFSTAVLWKASG